MTHEDMAQACITTADTVIKPLEGHPEEKGMLRRRLAMCIATLNVIRFEQYTDRRNIAHVETTLQAIGLAIESTEGELREAGILPDRRCPEDYVGE